MGKPEPDPFTFTPEESLSRMDERDIMGIAAARSMTASEIDLGQNSQITDAPQSAPITKARMFMPRE